MHEITSKEELDEIMSGERPAVIDFWGQSCGPCLAMAPQYEALAEHYAEENIGFYKLNTGQHPQLASMFNVRSIPMLLFFKGGEVKDQVIGLTAKEHLSEKLDALA